MTFFVIISKFFVFHPTPVFYAHTYKLTTTIAQFTFYNRKLHFTTAEIVISYTLRYALVLPVSSASAERNFSRLKKLKLHTFNNE